MALNQYRHFVLAAESCGVTQPTMSAMLQKLEDELGVKIFDRSNKKIEPTGIGSKIIQQAQVALNETHRIKEVVTDEIGMLSGPLKIGISPTIAPYIIPDFIHHFQEANPHVSLQINEMRNDVLYSEIQFGNLDMGISTTPPDDKNLIEIPLYHERFVIYLSEQYKNAETPSFDLMDTSQMWILREGHCMHNQNFRFCLGSQKSNTVYKAGSIDTLIRIVDRNGGFTIIPEMHLPFLSETQRANIHDIEGSLPTSRTVSILLKPDYIREKMVNAVANAVKLVIPKEMLDERIRKFDIRL